MPHVIIVGTGPAGISAALYARRANLEVTVIGKDDGALVKAEKIENYFGLEQPVAGAQLIETGMRQARGLGAKLVRDQVLDIAWEEKFTVRAQDATYDADAVILATGAARKTLALPGLREFEGKGVSYCAVCDGFFFRQKPVAVIGAGEYALHEAQALLPLAETVTVLTNAAETQAAFSSPLLVDERPVAEIFGDTAVRGVRFADGEALEVAGIFVALGTASAGDLARKLGAQVENDRIVVDENMQTGVPGLFAAGDCTGGLMQVSTAVAKGAQAAMSAITFLRGR